MQGYIVLSVIVMLTLLSFQDMHSNIDTKPAKYTLFKLTTDISKLEDHHKKMIPLLIEAADAMDAVFWMQAYGSKNALLGSLSDASLKKYAQINYGPWDRLAGNAPFVNGIGPKPTGANFYPKDMTKEEFEAWDNEDKTSLYTLVKRDVDGKLITVPYSVAFSEFHELAAKKIKEAAALARDAEFKRYLELRADALLSDEYQESDMAWMDNKNNVIELVIGPIENYEDQLFGYKAANEAYVLVKDVFWSDQLAKYAELLPALQKGLPVSAQFKAEIPGTDADLNAYDVIYYAGDCNAGSKTIAINLPNDEEVQLKKGSRRLQLKNAMKAKFDKILLPISNVLIDESQRDLITFDAFFNNTMFHEVAHGLGIKNTINDKGTVREALKNQGSALEEGKADILGLYMVTSLIEGGELDGLLEEHYVTFMASIFRSVRFGASSAHGKANMLRFNFFREFGAFTRDDNKGTYKVDIEKMREAMTALSQKILELQGLGDYDGVTILMEESGTIKSGLQHDLNRLSKLGIPVDVVFEQGLSVLGL